MLSAIVTTVKGLPGQGFFNLARKFGKLGSSDKEAKHRFWEQECNKVYEAWKVEFPKT